MAGIQDAQGGESQPVSYPRPSKMKIENRTFIISGGSSGLGLATVLELHKLGAYIAIMDIHDVPESARSTLDTKSRYFKTDLTKDAEVERAVKDSVAWSKQTGAKLGGVVNCAGVAVAQKVIASDGSPHPLDLFKFAIEVNLIGTFNLTRRVLEHLIKVEPEGADGERGVIIMVSSAAAFEGQQGQVAYSASKGAIRSMTLPMARDLGRYGIRVNTIAPSLFVSPMTDRIKKAKDSLIREIVFPRRFGESHEFAEVVTFMIQSSYLNGETIRLSAGGRMPGML